MASIFDSAASILLCAEDNKSIFGFDDEEVENAHGYGHGWVLRERSGFYGGFLMDFPLQSDECVGLLVERESEHIPRGDYMGRILSGALDPSVRRDAIDWIWKVGSLFFFFFFFWLLFSRFLGGSFAFCVFVGNRSSSTMFISTKHDFSNFFFFPFWSPSF